MTLQLPHEVEGFVYALVQSGRFADESAVVTAAVRLLEEQDNLSKQIQIGISQLDRGEGIPESELFPRLRARAAEIARQSQ